MNNLGEMTFYLCRAIGMLDVDGSSSPHMQRFHSARMRASGSSLSMHSTSKTMVGRVSEPHGGHSGNPSAEGDPSRAKLTHAS
jgi:hypothetical protein